MALVIETGALISSANSYISVDEFIAWAEARGVSFTLDDSLIEQNILRAMDYFESLHFLGIKADENQALQWPRDRVYIDGYSVDSDEIPEQVKASVYELVKIEFDGDSPISSQDRQTESEQVGDIKVVYSNKAMMRKRTPAFSHAVRKLIHGISQVSRS
jgi:hypothetical protein